MLTKDQEKQVADFCKRFMNREVEKINEDLFTMSFSRNDLMLLTFIIDCLNTSYEEDKPVRLN